MKQNRNIRVRKYIFKLIAYREDYLPETTILFGPNPMIALQVAFPSLEWGRPAAPWIMARPPGKGEYGKPDENLFLGKWIEWRDKTTFATQSYTYRLVENPKK